MPSRSPPAVGERERMIRRTGLPSSGGRLRRTCSAAVTLVDLVGHHPQHVGDPLPQKALPANPDFGPSAPNAVDGCNGQRGRTADNWLHGNRLSWVVPTGPAFLRMPPPSPFA